MLVHPFIIQAEREHGGDEEEHDGEHQDLTAEEIEHDMRHGHEAQHKTVEAIRNRLAGGIPEYRLPPKIRAILQAMDDIEVGNRPYVV